MIEFDIRRTDFRDIYFRRRAADAMRGRGHRRAFDIGMAIARRDGISLPRVTRFITAARAAFVLRNAYCHYRIFDAYAALYDTTHVSNDSDTAKARFDAALSKTFQMATIAPPFHLTGIIELPDAR